MIRHYEYIETLNDNPGDPKSADELQPGPEWRLKFLLPETDGNYECYVWERVTEVPEPTEQTKEFRL